MVTHNPPSSHENGFLFIDKPEGMTSHDVVDRVRRLTSIRKVGHAGTLDPFATGLLLVGVGRAATKHMQGLVGLDKVYEATFYLGGTSDTDDRTGDLSFSSSPLPSQEEVKEALPAFLGEIQQVPPTYSAVKIQGKKMYELARAGQTPDIPARTVHIYAMDLLEAIQPHSVDGHPVLSLNLRIHSSSGTYIRSLARDLGEKLGVGGYVETLRRTAIEPFSLEESVKLANLTPEVVFSHLQTVEDILSRRENHTTSSDSKK